MPLTMVTADMTRPTSSEHVMKAIISSSMSPSTSSASAAAVGGGAFSDDCSDDGCSICLEPFSLHDPPTVTNCNHEYHLHCILEWSQRSTECPICCQLLALKNPTSQELLEAAKSERVTESRSNIRIVQEDHEGVLYVNESYLEDRILQHFAAATGRTRNDRRRMQTSTGIDSSEVFSPVSFGTMSNMLSIDSRNDGQSIDYGLEVRSTMTGAPASTIDPESSPVLTGENRDGPLNHRIFFAQTSPDGPSRSSEFIAFPESVKAKFSAASARYKESITKSTRGFKEKLLARNSTIKELGRGVQREMSAGIAGVARMIERLDLSSKRTGVPVPFSASSVEKPNLADRGLSLEESTATQSPVAVPGETMDGMSSGISPFNSTTIPTPSGSFSDIDLLHLLVTPTSSILHLIPCFELIQKAGFYCHFGLVALEIRSKTECSRYLEGSSLMDGIHVEPLLKFTQKLMHIMLGWFFHLHTLRIDGSRSMDLLALSPIADWVSW